MASENRFNDDLFHHQIYFTSAPRDPNKITPDRRFKLQHMLIHKQDVDCAFRLYKGCSPLMVGQASNEIWRSIHTNAVDFSRYNTTTVHTETLYRGVGILQSTVRYHILLHKCESKSNSHMIWALYRVHKKFLNTLNSLKPSGEYMRLWAETSMMLLIISCRLFGNTPLHEPKINSGQLDPEEHNWVGCESK